MRPSLPTVDLKGQVAIVTGRGRGIGRTIAHCLAAAGAAVAVVGRSRQHLEETACSIQNMGGQATALAADVTDRAAIELVVQEAEHRLGTVDVLVNNAAVGEAYGPVSETNPDDWW